MFYDRKIKYLDYCENGERIRGGGYVKLEVRNACLQIDLSVTGLYPTDAFEREVLLCSSKKDSSVGRIQICDGKGRFRQECHNIDNISNTGISYEELRGIRIPLAIGREISCIWGEVKNAGSKVAKEVAAAEVSAGRTEANRTKVYRKEEREAEGKEGKSQRYNTKGSERGQEKRSMWGEVEEKPKSGNILNRIREKGESGSISEDAAGKYEGRSISEDAAGKYEGGSISGDAAGKYEGRSISRDAAGKYEGRSISGDAAEKQKNRRISERKRENRGSGNTLEGERGMLRNGGRIDEGEKQDSRNGSERERKDHKSIAEKDMPIQLLEDKWQQLYAIYPHIRPFDDEREYISIRPADFVLFPAESYRMVNNSFLLHGYYNYKHLLLAKVEQKGEIRYYIGVPGNFYEKEKQVAIMFGFESFECAEEPAQAGDFGYYMMRTNL